MSTGLRARRSAVLKAALSHMEVGVPVLAREVADKIGFTPAQVAGAFKALENKGYMARELGKDRVNVWTLLEFPGEYGVYAKR